MQLNPSEISELIKSRIQNLAPQNLLRAGNGERRDLAAQHFLCPRDLLLDLGFRPRYKPFALGPRRILCFFDDFHRALFCLRKNILCLLSCVAQQLGCPLGGLFEILLAAFSGRQALGDLLLTLLDRAQERRPYELDREPDKQRKRERLREQRQVDVHE